MVKALDVTGLILAGGESRRFGTDKARHLVEGRPMIRHVYETLTAVVEDVLVSVGKPGHDTGLPAEHVCDHYPNAGPLAGLHAGLLRCRTPWLLAVACDMPYLTEDVLSTLLAARYGATGPIVTRTPAGQRHPLCALYPRDMLGDVETALKARRLALVELLEHTSSVVEVDVPALPLHNVNRLQDLSGGQQGLMTDVSPR